MILRIYDSSWLDFEPENRTRHSTTKWPEIQPKQDRLIHEDKSFHERSVHQWGKARRFDTVRPPDAAMTSYCLYPQKDSDNRNKSGRLGSKGWSSTNWMSQWRLQDGDPGR